MIINFQNLGLDFLVKMLSYDSTKRSTAADCLVHNYLSTQRKSQNEKNCNKFRMPSSSDIINWKG